MSDLLLLIVAVLALAGHSVVIVGFVNRTHAYGWPRDLVDGLTLVSGLLLLGIPLYAGWLVWAGGGLAALLPPGWIAWYGVAMALVGVFAGLHSAYLLLHPERRGVVVSSQVRRHDFRKRHGLSLAAPVPRAFCRVPGNQVLTISIEEKRLAIPGLPEELAGLKIAQLSDLHMSGRFAMPMFQEIVEFTNEWAPDLVTLTGDLIEKDQCLPWIAETYGRLQAPLGVCYVLGNHDKKCSHQQVRELLDQTGAVDVSRGCVSLEHHGAGIEVVGNELPWFAPPSEFAGAQGAFRLVLAHGPDQFFWAIARDANLVLAGHNHGGQVRFPLLGALLTPSVSGTRYTAGTFVRGQTVMHVSRGTGSLAPFRFACPPELTLLVLERGDGTE